MPRLRLEQDNISSRAPMFRFSEDAMRGNVFTLAFVFAFVCSGCFARVASADEAPVTYHGKSVQHACHQVTCVEWRGAHRGVRSRGYTFQPLYGAYGPYGGVGYWGAYTVSGWGYR